MTAGFYGRAWELSESMVAQFTEPFMYHTL